MVDSYDLNYLKTKFFQLRSVNNRQTLHIFMISRSEDDDYLLIGPFSSNTKEGFNIIYPMLEDFGLRGTVFPIPYKPESDAGSLFRILDDPTRNYDLYVSQSRTNDNGSIVRINEFVTFTELCESNEKHWLYEDVVEEPKLPGYSPVSLLTILTYLYMVNVAIKANYIYIDIKRKQYHIFDLFEQRNDKEREDFFFVERVPAKCKFYENMSKYFSRMIPILEKVYSKEPELENRRLAAIKFFSDYPSTPQTGWTTASGETLTSKELLHEPFTKQQGKFFVNHNNLTKSITFSGKYFYDVLHGLKRAISRSETNSQRKSVLFCSAELYMFKDVKPLFDMFIKKIKLLAIEILYSDYYLIIQIIKALNNPDFNTVQSVFVQLYNHTIDESNDVKILNTSSYINTKHALERDGEKRYLEILNDNSKSLNLTDFEEKTFGPILSKIDDKELHNHFLLFIVSLRDKSEDLFNICFSLLYYWEKKDIYYTGKIRGIIWDIMEKQLYDVEGKISEDDKNILYNNYIDSDSEYSNNIIFLLLARAFEENKAPKKLLTLEAFDDLESYLTFIQEITLKK